MNIDPDGEIQKHIAIGHQLLDEFRADIAEQIASFIELRQNLLEAGDGNEQNLQFVNGVLTRLTGWYIADLNDSGSFILHSELTKHRDLVQEFHDECKKLEEALRLSPTEPT